MSKKKKFKKTKYDVSKKKNFIVKNSILITILISVISIFINFLIYYDGKTDSTNFYVTYEAIKIGNINSNSDYYKKLISYPTVENDVEKILDDFSISLDGYYVLYLVVTQYGETPNKTLNINFSKYGKYSKGNMSKSITNSSENYNEKISISLSKNESIKIPIAICKTSKETRLISDFIYVKYEPNYMVYSNKYLFSKKTKKIRKLENINLYIDGDTLGMGGERISLPSKWYLRK